MLRLWFTLVLIATVASATTRRVPEDYPSIQSALSSVNSGDTVLVQPGIYAESLQAPNTVFQLLGIVDPDATPTKPLVDPSPLAGSTHLACLTLPFGSNVVIKDFIFRNGAQMYPRDGFTDVGGIRYNGQQLSVERCRFDSTYGGIVTGAGGHLSMNQCQLQNSVWSGVFAGFSASHAVIRNTSFFARTGRLLSVMDSSRVEFCSFQSLEGGEWTWMQGPRIIVRGCNFGPTLAPDTTIHAMIWTSNSSGCLFENNYFHDLQLYGAAVLFNSVKGDTTCFRDNVFERNTAVGLQLQGPNIRVRNNLFDSCFADASIQCRAINLLQTQALLHGNIFNGPAQPRPHIYKMSIALAVMHECRFNDTGWALHVSGEDSMNAENNWWGDDSGPYHAELNPAGLGDTITGEAIFVPWLLDTVDTVADPPPPLPVACQLQVYPNPFNAQTSLRFVVPEPGNYHINLYNTLGQHVRQIWTGVVSGRQDIAFDAHGLASGIYFLGVRASTQPVPAHIQKLVLIN